MAQRWRIALGLNGVVVGSLILLGVYVKFGQSLEPEAWRRAENAVRLFSDGFTREQPFYGLANSLSQLLWAAAVSLWLFSATLVRRTAAADDRFLLSTGLLTGLWMLDDVIGGTVMLTLFLGMPKAISAVAYGLLLLAYGRAFWPQLKSTPYGYLAVAVGLFGLSSLVDSIGLTGQAAPTLIEEGFKLMGLVNLVFYSGLVCDRTLAPRLSKPPAQPNQR